MLIVLLQRMINQLTKKPLLADQTDVTGTIGSRGYYRATGDFNVRTGEDSAFRLNAMCGTRPITAAPKSTSTASRRRTAGAWVRATNSRSAVSSERGQRAARRRTVVAHRPAGDHRLQRQRAPGVGALGTIAPIKPGEFYGTTADQLLGKARYGTAAWMHRFDDGSELRTQVRTGTFDRTQWSSAAGFLAGTNLSNFNDSTVLTRSGLTPRKDEYKGTYLQSDYSKSVSWGSTKHEILAGVDASKEEADRFQNDAFINTSEHLRRNTERRCGVEWHFLGADLPQLQRLFGEVCRRVLSGSGSGRARLESPRRHPL